MITPKMKGFKKVKLSILKPKEGDERNRELSDIPGYVCYKAALIREKVFLGRLLIAISTLFIFYFLQSRFEIYSLHGKLRSKEYILAPGVQSFTPAHPHMVPDEYISDAVNDFITNFGTVNRHTIENQFRSLKRFMTAELQVKFDRDTRKWVDQVQKDDIAQIIRPLETKIVLQGDGSYEITAMVKADLYSSGDDLGQENQVIQMKIQLVPPARDKRWFLQIQNFTWSKVDEFKQRNLTSLKGK